jgi:hypothetical protein
MKERGLGFDADRALIHPLSASNAPSTEQALSMKLGWFTKRRGPEPSNDRELQRAGETVVVDVVQDGNSFVIEGDGIHIHYAVEGVELPRGADPSFAAWGLLAPAMAEGINIRINRPIDPEVAANATRLSQIWEMWVPGLYRSICIGGSGEWSRRQRTRLPPFHFYSGGVDSTFSLLRHSDLKRRGHAVTVFGLDYRCDDSRSDGSKFADLIAKTDPLLDRANFDRIVVRTNSHRRPQSITHSFTLASCAFLLRDLFEGAILPADRTPAQDMVTFPWGTNHVTNPYFKGTDFAIQTACAELSRTEKLAIMSPDAWPYIAFCRNQKALPANCGKCNKCIRTKAMFIAATGTIPELFIDNSFDEELMLRLGLGGREPTHLFDLYVYAKDRGLVDKIPGLSLLVEKCRQQNAASVKGADRGGHGE